MRSGSSHRRQITRAICYRRPRRPMSRDRKLRRDGRTDRMMDGFSLDREARGVQGKHRTPQGSAGEVLRTES